MAGIKIAGVMICNKSESSKAQMVPKYEMATFGWV